MLLLLNEELLFIDLVLLGGFLCIGWVRFLGQERELGDGVIASRDVLLVLDGLFELLFLEIRSSDLPEDQLVLVHLAVCFVVPGRGIGGVLVRLLNLFGHLVAVE